MFSKMLKLIMVTFVLTAFFVVTSGDSDSQVKPDDPSPVYNEQCIDTLALNPSDEKCEVSAIPGVFCIGDVTYSYTETQGCTDDGNHYGSVCQVKYVEYAEGTAPCIIEFIGNEGDFECVPDLTKFQMSYFKDCETISN